MNWTLPRLRPGEPFPPAEGALPAEAPYPGLLAAGGRVDAPTLRAAYAGGIFPWFGEDEPPLWWSPDPRMVLLPGELRVRRSLRQSARRLSADPRFELRVDGDFAAVMRACAQPRAGVAGTWIGPSILQAYAELHAQGLAHSFELWRDGELVAGLYLVALGAAAFGESMFTRVDDGSKLLLMALCGFALSRGLRFIDCQQQTGHLASLGARPWPRGRFLRELAQARELDGVRSWQYDWTQFRQHCAAWL
ncbi:leucyl/phenylalanyl-tRNA--protein transferase [Thiomonas sp. FB-6]|uniref:leucyl/phenylalanyl-tRNA--protein transferase n=1 Tax=Thiomonas sp. FB-6 TaxID=1158291 RepID=UPI00036BEAAA|nr:leucyl/phenylalanyl-tRNA--protein transferase [Thiomonas sp. FB-6]